jgi:hypothetical protein
MKSSFHSRPVNTLAIAVRDAVASRRLQQVTLMSFALLSLVAFALSKAG